MSNKMRALIEHAPLIAAGDQYIEGRSYAELARQMHHLLSVDGPRTLRAQVENQYGPVYVVVSLYGDQPDCVERQYEDWTKRTPINY